MIFDAIEELYDALETIETRRTAQTLFSAMCDFSFLCFFCLWNNVLKEVNHAQKYLHILGISFEDSVIKLRSLNVFLKDKRYELIEDALQFAKDTCEEMDIPAVKKNLRRKKIILERRLQTSR
ncbi:hypothetical protein AVEN_257089-1 [Araneus ventricosus]|uniref:Uncharacterized protein n=1 Tax=Araneus ventricosus TaxID=182803 RepID=A0A4Y2QH85_ARAVE|nr:hypothetical protein AVEN_184495-1 [Araneus ventricosus]GBN62644.1 hypothetical protein AVEN_257089-1 [Araneus ventricosus]